MAVGNAATHGGASGPGAPDRWLVGRGADLVFGCGLGYLAWILVLGIPGVTPAFAPWVPFAAAMLALVTNTPHYGATLLRVYEHRSDRSRYALFAVHGTLLIAALFVGGVYWTPLGHLVVTLYVTWSPWHFAGQNYGLGLMFLRRRGVVVEERAKRLLYASFGLSFLLTFLALHGGEAGVSVAPVPADVYGHYQFLSLGIPAAISRPAFAITAVAYALVLIALAVSLRRRARAIDLLPTGLLIGLQAVWFSIPAWLAMRGDLSVRSLAISTIWISMAHSIQYLWITRYYAQRTEHGALSAYLGKTILAGAGLSVLPALVFAPQLLGTVPYHAGLAGLLFSAINLHHFLLDGAIWKLRDGRIARVLLRAESDAPGAVEPESRLARRVLWAVCAVALAVALANAWELEFGVSRAIERGDTARLQQAEQRLRWIGRESEVVHHHLGLQLAMSGQNQAARRELERSLALYPRAETWTTLGNLERIEGDYAAALAALDRALALAPEFARAHQRRGETLAQMGELDGAFRSLREAQRLAPEDRVVADSLRALRRLREGARERQ